jgi:glucose-fructose oxidoreductase
MAPAKRNGKGNPDRLKWAVVGLGHFAQTAVLPAFAHVRKSCKLAALFSDDRRKRKRMGDQYKVRDVLPYDEYDAFLASGAVDAVYIALPNDLHRDYTVRAARAGVHVLCEKPLAPTEEDCRAMIDACREAGVKLMVAYRLHFEEANLTAVDLARRGKLGELRYFSSVFSLPVDEGNIRTNPTEQGGGPLYDIGIYCINAARYLFQDEPTEVVALAASREGDERFAGSDEQLSATLRFPGERLANFTASFGGADSGWYELVGSKGSLRLDPAYEYAAPMVLQTRIGEKVRKRKFGKRDQIAPELEYFARCVRRDEQPEPSGWEGLHDVRIIRSILESARTGQKVAIDLPKKRDRPTLEQAREHPPVAPPDLVNAEPPSGG